VGTAFAEQFGIARPEGPPWLAEVRARAMGRFQAAGYPTTKNEDWHFTNPSPIAEATFEPMRAPTAALTVAGVSAWNFGEEGWPRLVFVNGRFVPALSRFDGLEGIRVMSLAAAYREEPSLLERHLTRQADYADPAQVFTAVNTALMHDGAVIHVQKGAAARMPVHVLFLSDAAAAGGSCHPRVLIVAEPQSEATIVEQYATAGGERYFTNAVTEAWVGDGANLRLFRLQQEARNAFHVGTTAVRQERNSHFVSFSFATGGDLSRINVYVELNGQGCGATLNGLYMLDGTQHCDHQTRIVHAEPDCYSRELYKGILDDASHGVFNGKVYVHPAAQKTDGKQTNNTLLLSDRARIDTKPQLEIFADDVKCTHGATVGRIDETALFYMKSRGIPNSEARKLLTYAFAAEVLETIPVDSLRDSLERLTLERFTGTVNA
jgi:Fe-S cluster assembly protein SufD